MNQSIPFSIVFLVVLFSVGLVACERGSTAPHPDGGTDGGEPLCGFVEDRDGDTIPDDVEGPLDTDGDGIPDLADEDSDGDTYPDVEEAGDADCSTEPRDRDGDGTPDYLDTDANGDAVLDEYQRDTDFDEDGIVDYLDDDVDEDGIPNAEECCDESRPRDADGDGTPDVFDSDADGDSILDGHEGTEDDDGDGLPNYLDDDSDGDGVSDALEAGDGDLLTPPVVCGNEIDPATGDVSGDGYPDYRDPDSDNDGLGDGDERDLGTDPCAIDTDDDGIDDLAEGAYERLNCPDGPGSDGVDCGCASSAACGIPDEHFFVVLPFGPEEIERDLDFATSVQVADIFFLTDITGSMGGTLERVQNTVARPGTGIMDRIGASISDAYFGGGTFQDLPLWIYGSPGDTPFSLVVPMTAPARADEVRTRWGTVFAQGGSDAPESHTEALFQTLTGSGPDYSYMSGIDTYSSPDYRAACLDGTWGAPCFRPWALPIIIMFSDICAHEGPPGENAACDPYADIAPNPARWGDAIAEMNLHGAKFIGIPTNGGCADETLPADPMSPCYYMRRTAEATGSVDLSGRPLVYDLPNGGATDAAFVNTVVGAVETVATQIRTTVDTATRDDASDEIDAREFIVQVKPGCAATPPLATCWEAPAGVAHDDALSGYDDSAFFDVVPGTRLTFRVKLRNTVFPGEERTRVFLAFIDVRGAAGNILSTRQVYVIVPALPSLGLM